MRLMNSLSTIKEELPSSLNIAILLSRQSIKVFQIVSVLTSWRILYCIPVNNGFHKHWFRVRILEGSSYWKLVWKRLPPSSLRERYQKTV